MLSAQEWKSRVAQPSSASETGRGGGSLTYAPCRNFRPPYSSISLEQPAVSQAEQVELKVEREVPREGFRYILVKPFSRSSVGGLDTGLQRIWHVSRGHAATAPLPRSLGFLLRGPISRVRHSNLGMAVW